MSNHECYIRSNANPYIDSWDAGYHKVIAAHVDS
jgi:hypothetical protein